MDPQSQAKCTKALCASQQDSRTAEGLLPVANTPRSSGELQGVTRHHVSLSAARQCSFLVKKQSSFLHKQVQQLRQTALSPCSAQHVHYRGQGPKALRQEHAWKKQHRPLRDKVPPKDLPGGASAERTQLRFPEAAGLAHGARAAQARSARGHTRKAAVLPLLLLTEAAAAPRCKRSNARLLKVQCAACQSGSMLCAAVSELH